MIDLGGGVELDVVWIPPGDFVMGSPEDEPGRGSGETQHRVTISDGFWMGKYEVTQRQYEQLIGENPSHFWRAGPDAPVETVDWNQAKTFCEKLERAPGFAAFRRGVGNQALRARLPTEAEWEYACRAGTTGPYAGAWYEQNSGGSTHPVGLMGPNAWGLYDMHGNVLEWCWDGYGKYPSGSVTNPTGMSSGSPRVLRGGSWDGNAANCRATNRGWCVPSGKGSIVGLRLVVVPR